MNKKYDVLDWQSFSEKKDIEEIVKNTKDKNDIQLTATIEIAMAVSSILADNLFKENMPIYIFMPILLISIIPLIWLFTRYLIRFINRNKAGGDIPDINTMVNLFDNEICYYVLMADSYSEKLDNIDVDNVSNVERFHFIETCFYINKAIYNLSATSNSIDKLYTTDDRNLYANRRISYTRLKNIFNILDACIERTENYYSIISDIDINCNYINLCKQYKESYNRFKRLFTDIDPQLLGQ